MKFKLYIKNVLLGLDEFANTLIGGAPGDTISGRCYRARADNLFWGTLLANILDRIQKNHCAEANVNDEAGRHTEADPVERKGGDLD